MPAKSQQQLKFIYAIRNKYKSKKEAPRISGYKRLFQLLDWMALEFYDENRLITIRGDDHEEDKMKVVNMNDHRVMKQIPPDKLDLDGEFKVDYYYPKVDVEVVAGEGIRKSKAFTLAVTQELSQVQITPQNAPLIKVVVELLELPNQQEILDAIDTVASMGGGEMGAGMPSPEGGGGFEEMMSTLPPEQQQIVGQMLETMSPQEQQAFMALPPDQQVDMISQALSG
jgi:hypothetical protein